MNTPQQTIKTWIIVGLVFAGLYSALSAVSAFPVLATVAFAVIALLFWTGTFLGDAGFHRTAWITYLIGGILALPPGIVMIIASGKIRRAAGAPEIQNAAPTGLSAFARVTGSLFTPKKALADVAGKPNWVAPLVLLTVLSLLVTGLLMQKMDWGSYMRLKGEENPRFAQMSEAQKTDALATQEKYVPVFVWGAGLLVPGIYVLLLVLIYWGAFRLFSGADVRFGAAFGIGAHAFLPSALASLLAVVTLALKSRGDVDPERLLATNVGAFLPTDVPKWLQTLGGSLDLFMVWVLALFAVGFAAASPKKVKTGTAFIVVFGLWGVWVLGKVAWAAL